MFYYQGISQEDFLEFKIFYIDFQIKNLSQETYMYIV